MRSAAKPMQAAVALRLGVRLPPEWLAVACASHSATPAHEAIVEAILSHVGLSADHLGCPPDWPMGSERDRRIRAGYPEPRRIWHNCSGKHAAMLAACVAQGWDTRTYLAVDHPLQNAIRNHLMEVTGGRLDGPGVDGCGAPVWATSVRAMAQAYAHLAASAEYVPVWTAMHRFAPLTAEYPSVPTALARWTETVSKYGAEGLLGIAARPRLGVAIKVWDGSSRAMGPVAGAVCRALGLSAPATADRLDAELMTPVVGGGIPVGEIEASVNLS
jgi:L-asparaginase II